MPKMAEALARFRHQPTSPEGTDPIKLASTLDGSATLDEIRAVWGHRELPAELVEAWTISRQAHLFEDVDYGQWGLVLLTPAASAERTEREIRDRPGDFRPEDIVIGEFLGDQELLVLAASETGQRRILIALPLDSRAHWYGAAPDLSTFLERYFEEGGDKYWELRDLGDWAGYGFVASCERQSGSRGND